MDEELPPLPQTLQTKNTAEQLALAKTILDAAKRGIYPLSDDEKRVLMQFITLVAQKRPLPDELRNRMNFLVRQHEQNLIAFTRRNN